MALPVRAVAVALVVVLLAGCSGTGPGTTAPAPDATTVEPTSTGTSSASTVTTGARGDAEPPGVSNGSVVDAFALTDAHVDAVGDRSHLVLEESRLAYANGTPYLSASTSVAVGSNPDEYAVIAVREGSGVADRRTSTYANGSIVARHPAAGDAPYVVVSTPAGEPVAPSARYPGVPRNADDLALLLASSDETTATRVDADTYRVTAAGGSPDAVAVDGVELDAASNVTLELYVTDDGRVLNYTVAFDATRNGTTFAGEIRVQYRAVGATPVETPTWFRGNATGATESGRPAV